MIHPQCKPLIPTIGNDRCTTLQNVLSEEFNDRFISRMPAKRPSGSANRNTLKRVKKDNEELSASLLKWAVPAIDRPCPDAASDPVEP